MATAHVTWDIGLFAYILELVPQSEDAVAVDVDSIPVRGVRLRSGGVS